MNNPKDILPEEPFDPDKDHPAENNVTPEADSDELDLLNKGNHI